jgi:hypothetical protein
MVGKVLAAGEAVANVKAKHAVKLAFSGSLGSVFNKRQADAVKLRSRPR